MKIRSSILVLVAVAVVLIVLMLGYGHRKPAVGTQAAPTEPPSVSNANGGGLPVAPPANANASTTSVAAPASSIPSPAGSSSTARIKGILSTYNDQPIVFYGKLEDQFSNIISDATVTFEVRILNGNESTVKRGQVASDADGLFTISGFHGQDLSVVPKKAGYALASLNGGGSYSLLSSEEQRIHPDPYNPIIIKMWKLHEAEPLVSINLHYKLLFTDAPLNFDLLTGQIVPTGGDIRLTVNRSPGVMSGRSRLGWGVKIEAIDGGLMDSSGQETVTYEAPEAGYKPSMIFEFSTNPPARWFEEFNQGFFAMSRNGQVYSKLSLSFRINENPDDFMYVNFSGIANANGSRNWEGDQNTLNVDAK